MVVKYGMSEKIGMINYETEGDEVFIGREIGHAKTTVRMCRGHRQRGEADH